MMSLIYLLKRINEYFRVKRISNQEFRLFKKAYEQHDLKFMLNKADMKYYHLDKTSETEFDRHYVYHPAWAMRRIMAQNPSKHVDISSTLHFCSMLSAVMPVEFYDYRPPRISIDNLTVGGHIDLQGLPFESNSIDSLSCMHVVEHIGLGRYGDPIDPVGDLKAIKELKRVLGLGGDLYFVVPIGKLPKIIFNGQRTYSKDLVLEYFEGLQLKEFTLIPGHHSQGGLVIDPGDDLLNMQTNGCGCFWFTKR